MNISKEAQEVLNTIEKYGPIRSTEIVKMLNISSKTAHKHLSVLLDEELIKKIGSTPKVFYAIESKSESEIIKMDKNDEVIEKNYVYVSPSGVTEMGVQGFISWCNKNGFNYDKEKRQFVEALKSVQKLQKDGLYSAKKLILSGKKHVSLDEVYFSDFYTISHFGKTKLGQFVYLGKSSQNKKQIRDIAKNVLPDIKKIIKKHKIGAVCYIPPTIDRKLQFMDEFKKGLKLDLPLITAIKIPSMTKIPQKTLRKLEDRIVNAQETIAVNPGQEIDKNVLIVDDATGSGSTLNETAKKIRNISKHNIKIIGYSIVGSYKGFDVISEV